MKTALVIEQIDTSRGGAEHSSLEMASLLARRGLEVTLVTRWACRVPPNGFEIVDLAPDIPERFVPLWSFLSDADAYLSRREFDVVHAVTPVRRADVYQPRGGLIAETFARNVARRQGFSAALKRLFGPNGRQRRLQRIERYLAAESECLFLAVSDYVRRQCIEHLGLPGSRIRVIYNGVDAERLQRPIDPQEIARLRSLFGVRDDQALGLFVANNLKLKGMDLVIAALERLRRSDPPAFDRLKVGVVTSADFRGYQQRVEHLGLGDRFRFIGPAKEIHRVYGLADFLLHPTWYDPCSHVVLEAIVCGLPSVTTRFNGAAEIVREADCGMVLDELTVEAVASAMVAMIGAEYRRRLAANCGRAADRVTMARHVDELVNLYKELAER